MRIDGTMRRSSHSEDRSHRASRSVSRERPAVETNKHTQAEVHSRSRSLCRSADCPTPDLVSSRPCKADSKETNSDGQSLGHQGKRTPEQEASPERAQDNVEGERCGDERPVEAPCRRSEVCSGARQSLSVSRSPPAGMRVRDPERDEEKEHGLSCPETPSVAGQPGAEKNRHLPETSAASRGTRLCVQKLGSQEEGPIQEQGEMPAKVEDQPPASIAQSSRSSPAQRHNERLQSEGPGHDADAQCDGRPAETSGARNIAASSAGCATTIDEPEGSRAGLASEESRRNAEVDRTVVQRRIVATEPFPPVDTAEVYRAYPEHSSRGYSRAQRFPRERGDRFLPGMNRHQTVSPNAWYRQDRDERPDFPQPMYPVNTGRSVRLVARRGDRNPLITAQQRMRHATPNESQHVLLHNGIYQQVAQPNQRQLRRTPIHVQPAAGRSRKMVRYFCC